MIGGSGTIVGQFASNGGTLAPGNSIGTLERHRQLQPDRRRLSGRGQQRGPERQDRGQRHRHDRRRGHGAGAGGLGHLSAQHDLHHRHGHRRPHRHLQRRDQQSRLPDAQPQLRRQQRLSAAGADGERLRRRARRPATSSPWVRPSTSPRRRRRGDFNNGAERRWRRSTRNRALRHSIRSAASPIPASAR